VALKSDHLVAKLTAGQNIALVSDAGTPTIADPGYRLVAAARNAGVPVVPIPGVSAVITALSGAGLPADTFTFLGFPPSGGLARDRWFERLSTEPGTMAFYESPHRIERTMEDVRDVLVNRPCVLCRELTKVNEELVNWPNNIGVRPQGEFVVVIGPGTFEPIQEPDADVVAGFIGQVIEKLSLDESAASALAATHFSMPAIKVRKLLKKGRILLKRSSDNQLP